MSFIPTPVTLLGDPVAGSVTDAAPSAPGNAGSIISQLNGLNVAIDKLRVEVRETNGLLLRLILTVAQGQNSISLQGVGSSGIIGG